MKKFKSFLAVFMSAVILLCVMPINSFAANGIQSVDLELDIAPGVNIADWEDYLTVNTTGIEIEREDDYVGFFVYDENYLSTEGEFEVGGEYYFEIYFTADKGYVFPDSEYEFDGAFVNGKEANFYFFEDESGNIGLAVGYYYPLNGALPVVDLTVDLYGEWTTSMYYDYIDINNKGFYFYYGNTYPVKGYDAEGNEVDTFEAGETYTLEIFLEPREDCYFSKDDSGAYFMESVTVNGEDAEYYIGAYTTNDDYEFIKVTCQVTAKEAKFINDISINLDTDLDGVNVNDWADYITIKTDGIVFEDYLGDPAVWATDRFGNYVEKYSKGNIYSICICLRPEEGYFFPLDDVVESVTINGDSNYNYYIDSYTAEDGTEITYICIETEVDLVGDGFFDQLIYFFKTLFEDIRNFFLNLFVEQY